MVYLDDSSDATTGGTYRVQMQLSGVLSGPLVVKASRYPVQSAGNYITATTTGSFPTVTATVPSAGFWYFWLGDNDGETGPFGVGVLATCSPWLVGVGNAVRDILIENKPRIDHMLQMYHPDASITTIEYGFSNSQVNAPFIVVTAPKFTSQVVAMPNTYEYGFALTIAVVTARANDETDETSGAAAVVQEISRILNQPYYSTRNLCDGCALYFCHASGGKAEMIATPVQDGYMWFAVGDISWSGNLLVAEGA